MNKQFLLPSGKSADSLDFSQFPNFTKAEWPADTLKYIDGNLIHLLQAIRNFLPDNSGLIPSPLVDGWYRTTGSTTSRHFIGDKNSGKLSIAGDVFMRNIDPFLILGICQHLGIHGVGIYFDTFYGTRDRVTPLLHIDLRPENQKSFWIRTRTINNLPSATNRGDIKYIYPLNSKAQMLEAQNTIKAFNQANLIY